MASAKGVRGPHDRDPSLPRRQCIKLGRTGQRCKRKPTTGTNLCAFHYAQANGQTSSNAAKGKLAQQINRAVNEPGRRRGSTTALVVSDQARAALVKLGRPVDDKIDPKMALLDTVTASVRQRELWESMLAAIPAEDFQYVGMPPIPGSPGTAKGARIEVIQKNLAEATKNASRIAKLALDAGIEERLVRLAEEQSALIADTVKAAVIAAIASLRLPVGQESTTIEAALGAAATHLRLLAAGEAGPTAVGGEILDGIAVAVDMPLELDK